MNRRKIKKELKRLLELTDDKRYIKHALKDLKLIRVWEKTKHENSKSNMKILTNNFYKYGKFIF